jgi:type IV secretory pathway TraG/TraD family ATPase VirD4
MIFDEVIEGQQLHTLADGTIVRKGRAAKGIRGLNNTGVVLDEEIFSKHILALGSIGSGKTNLLYHIVKTIISSLTEDDIIVFFDAKGDYIKEFYRGGIDCVIGNKKRLVPEYNVVLWNVFEDILISPADERLETVREVATSLFKKYIDSSQNPTFIMGARDLLCALIMIALREMEGKGERWSNKRMKDYLNRATAKEIRAKLLEYDDLYWATSYVMSDNSPTTQSYLSPLFMVAQEIFSGSFAEEGDFSIRKAIQEKGGRSIFLEYDIASGNILQAIYTVLIDLAMKESLGQGKPKGNVYFVLDEFPLIPRVNYMDNALNFGRSQGVKVIAGIQNVGQVEFTYTEALAQSLLSGFGTFFAFRLFDEKSRNIVSERHGKNRKKIGYMSSASFKGVNDMILETNTIEDWDITKLNIGQCIVSLPNEEPFLFYPVQYG